MSNHAQIINDRRLAFGPRSDLMAISPAKHKWARDLWRKMKANNWDLHETDLTDDGPCYRNRLTEGERFAYDSALSFASNLDGIQLHNLANIEACITSPEVEMCIKRQMYEEALHVDAYSEMVETVSADPMSVYMRFERDGMLAAKNEHILRQARILAGEKTPAQFARSIVANVALEGIYFYSAFLVFYALARNGKMIGSADSVKLIHRDERTHLDLFAKMHETMKQERPELYDAQFYRDAELLLRDAVELESKWGAYITSKGVLGLTAPIVAGFLQERANECAKLIGMPELYPGVKTPVPWFVPFSQGEEVNFFEGKVADYAVGTLTDWD
ncbi:ribonucleotide-diphosphate reductase subunit beta [Burkholderia anthina]|uniref:ribonucleotide-diphosphate reductase subunit beta n=1 Tax=Burkholderia anthina TaxID=179879 RepID=UPI000AC8E6C9|nr:ribonucleotide-diphosphate reductase subunit beta [Burkholderia anthina]